MMREHGCKPERASRQRLDFQRVLTMRKLDGVGTPRALRK
jgi:hypothetical protein